MGSGEENRRPRRRRHRQDGDGGSGELGDGVGLGLGTGRGRGAIVDSDRLQMAQFLFEELLKLGGTHGREGVNTITVNKALWALYNERPSLGLGVAFSQCEGRWLVDEYAAQGFPVPKANIRTFQWILNACRQENDSRAALAVLEHLERSRDRYSPRTPPADSHIYLRAYTACCAGRDREHALAVLERMAYRRLKLPKATSHYDLIVALEKTLEPDAPPGWSESECLRFNAVLDAIGHPEDEDCLSPIDLERE